LGDIDVRERRRHQGKNGDLKANVRGVGHFGEAIF
jgi:hypothetical protein